MIGLKMLFKNTEFYAVQEDESKSLEPLQWFQVIHESRRRPGPRRTTLLHASTRSRCSINIADPRARMVPSNCFCLFRGHQSTHATVRGNEGVHCTSHRSAQVLTGRSGSLLVVQPEDFITRRRLMEDGVLRVPVALPPAAAAPPAVRRSGRQVCSNGGRVTPKAAAPL